MADRLDTEMCSGGESLVPTGSASAALRTVGSCEELPDLLRSAMIEQAREQVMASRCRVLATDCSPPDSGSAFGCGGEVMAEDAAAAPAPNEGAEDYSTTNTQEQGVDEADFVKNDGEHVYVLAGGELQILDAWPAATTAIVSSTPIEGTPQALYVHQDRAIVYSYDPSRTCYDSYNYDSWYGYGCISGDTTTVISILDITDRAHPVLTRRIELDGAYVSSRRIDAAVHTVVAFPGVQQLPNVQTYLPTAACSYESSEELEDDVAELIERNTEVILAADVGAVLPRISDTTFFADGTAETRSDLFGGCESVLAPPLPSSASFLTVLSFDLGTETAPRVASIVGEQGVVYASPSSLYVASVANPGSGSGFEATTIHRFALESAPAGATYQSSGRVGGRVLNQFSLGEHEGYLRVATTTGHVPSPTAFNSVYVLAQQGAALATVGLASPIALSEDIRAARFVGTRGFIVTFKKTDPLFVIDLGDPRQPRVAGELQIPGFSTYIHMIDETHLLTIGYEASDQGEFAWFQGIQLQLFDVGDPTNPTLLHKQVIGTRGTSSEAATNHLAFNYYPPLGVLAIPMAICEGGSSDDGAYGEEMTFNGLMIFDVSVAGGIAERGRIHHELVADDLYGNGCYHWWTEPTAGVQRSIFMEDYAYSIARDEIVVADLDDLATPLASVDLPGTPDGDW